MRDIIITAERERVRTRIEPRIAMRLREEFDPEGWSRRAILLYSDVERIIGPEPPGFKVAPCERGWWGGCRGERRPCEPCEERLDWEYSILEMVRGATGWALCESGSSPYSPSGRRYSTAPIVFRHATHRKIVVVFWDGGIDV